MAELDQYLTDNADRFVSELQELLRVPSVSARSEHRDDMQQMARMLIDGFKGMGLDAELVETPGHPIVLASWEKAEGAPTVVVYGHYDVQPAEPLDQWDTPPFEPTIREGHIYARGATDDKGQMFTHVKSVESWLQTVGHLPVNVKFVIEGEEEVGSSNLEEFLEQNRERLKCDVAVISDTSQYAPGMPAITYGLRGIMACEVVVDGPRQDLHSGMFGGSIANPANAIAKMVAALHDDQGRVQVPGFYDGVAELGDEERAQLAELPFDESAYLDGLGVNSVWGEEGFSTLERRWGRPTCDVNGVVSGYTGEGPKTIIPATAMAKISCRLVPDQDPQQIADSLEQFLRAECLPGLKVSFRRYHGAGGLVIPPDSPYMQAAARAIEKSFGTAPVMIREGGSIPVVTTFKDVLGVDTLLLGWGQDTDNLHSPNERFSLDDFQRGIRASAWLWEELAKA